MLVIDMCLAQWLATWRTETPGAMLSSMRVLKGEKGKEVRESGKGRKDKKSKPEKCKTYSHSSYKTTESSPWKRFHRQTDL